MPMVAMAVGAVVLVLVLVLAIGWRIRQVPESGEALIISGLGAKSHNRDTAESLGFKIVTGRGALVLPGFQTCRRLRVGARTVELDFTCATSGGEDVRVRGAVTYRVGDGRSSIAAAARRFLDQQDMMDEKTREIFARRLGSVADDLAVAFTDRGRLADEVRDSAAREMGRLGLVVDSLRIRGVRGEDPGQTQ